MIFPFIALRQAHRTATKVRRCYASLVGQGVAEYAVILAIVAIAAVASVTLLGSDLSELLRKGVQFGQSGANGGSNATGTAGTGNGNSLANGSTFFPGLPGGNAGTNPTGSGAGSNGNPVDPSNTAYANTGNSNSNSGRRVSVYRPGMRTVERDGQLYLEAEDGNTYMIDTAAGLGNQGWLTNEKAQEILNLASQLQSADQNLASELVDLGVTGMVLSRRQFQAANGPNTPTPFTDPDQIIRIYNREGLGDYLMNAYYEGGRTTFVLKDDHSFRSAAHAAVGAMDTAAYFQERFESIRQKLPSYGLNASDQNRVQTLGQSIIDNAPVYTTENATQTANDSITIGNCAGGRC
ncbi:MAG: hypothetical protein SFZ03_09035 [Candidatus Melainabacteria bacterium]|nr:hypothetical protein [Candidatus Melainabacteria bacterium]